MKSRKYYLLSIISLMIILLCGCDKNIENETTTALQETFTMNNTESQTEYQPESKVYNFPTDEESFDLSVNGVKIQLGTQISKILADLNARPFYYDAKDVQANQIGGMDIQVSASGYGTLGVGGYNKTQEIVYSSDTYAFQIGTDILNNRDMVCTFKDGITFGSTYEDVIEVYGEPVFEEDIVFENQFNSLGGQPTDQFCEENGIPLKYGDEGKFLRYKKEKKLILNLGFLKVQVFLALECTMILDSYKSEFVKSCRLKSVATFLLYKFFLTLTLRHTL